MLLYLVWLLPLVGAVLLWAFGPQLKSWAGPIGSALIGVSFAATVTLWNEATAPLALHVPLVTWLPGWALGLQLDRLSLVWTLIITGVGFLIHV
jgi:NADH-quinone oxidoreductase subunit L